MFPAPTVGIGEQFPDGVISFGAVVRAMPAATRGALHLSSCFRRFLCPDARWLKPFQLSFGDFNFFSGGRLVGQRDQRLQASPSCQEEPTVLHGAPVRGQPHLRPHGSSLRKSPFDQSGHVCTPLYLAPLLIELLVQSRAEIMPTVG